MPLSFVDIFVWRRDWYDLCLGVLDLGDFPFADTFRVIAFRLNMSPARHLFSSKKVL
jgi:hypothetical protein